jgi:hypothetical protein
MLLLVFYCCWCFIVVVVVGCCCCVVVVAPQPNIPDTLYCTPIRRAAERAHLIVLDELLSHHMATMDSNDKVCVFLKNSLLLEKLANS